MIRGRERAGLLTLALALLPVLVGAQGTTVDLAGHVKYRLVGTAWPDDSLVHPLAGDGSLDQALELRLNLDVRRGPWELDADYQLLGLYGDTIEFTRDLPVGTEAFFGRYPQDETLIVVLSNVESAPINELRDGLAAIVFSDR